jgi:hypothetical protein
MPLTPSVPMLWQLRIAPAPTRPDYAFMMHCGTIRNRRNAAPVVRRGRHNDREESRAC